MSARTILAIKYSHSGTHSPTHVHGQHPLIDANDRRTKANKGEMSAKEDYIIANRLLVLDFLLSAQTLLEKPEGLYLLLSLFALLLHLPLLLFLVSLAQYHKATVVLAARLRLR